MIYDLREGLVPGCADSVEENQSYTGNGWGTWIGQTLVGRDCTFIHVDHSCGSQCDPQVRSLREPFESNWMKTVNGSATQFGQPLSVRLFNADRNDYEDVMVLGTLNMVTSAGGSVMAYYLARG